MRAKHWLLIAGAAVVNVMVIGLLLLSLEDEPYELPAPPFYLSLGDSYAQGFQLNGDLSNGFAHQVVDRMAEQGRELALVNLGCGGATTTGMLETPGCTFPAEDAPEYAEVPQVVAAEEFLRSHAGQVELITLSVGANDVSLCVATPDPVSCSDEVIDYIGPKLTELVSRLRAAAGPDVPIIGITYFNTNLGRWVVPPVDENFARLSAEIYRQIFNPVLREAYEKAGATFVDVTEATGGYGPFDETTILEPFGELPEPVATVCRLTNYCEHGDIHPNTDGYAVIADLVVATLPDATLPDPGG